VCSSFGIEHLAPERSEQFGCNQSIQTSGWQCWLLCSICSGQRLVPPQTNFRGTQAAAKRKVVGVKRNRKASCGWVGALGRGAGRGGCGRGLGRLVCLSSEEEADIIAPDVNKRVDTGADATQEQVMPVQAHPHVQCGGPPQLLQLASSWEQLPLVAQCMQ
jgi:hypothetical protein